MQIRKSIKKNVLILITIALMISGCSTVDFTRYPDGANFVRDERLSTPNDLPEVSFSIINTGELRHAEAFLISGGSWLKTAYALIPCVLVRHPQEMLLYDTGVGNNAERDFKEAMPLGFLYLYTPKGSAHSQLQKSGAVDPGSVRTIIMSHLHWDHASGIEDFPNANIWTTNADYNYAIKKAGVGFARSMFKNDKIKWRFISFENKPYENFDQSMDVFGDGSIVLVGLPGHTPGLTGMFINMKSGKRFLFIGDASLYSDDLKVPAKSWMEKYFVDDDKKQTDATIARIYRLMKQYPDLVVISAHDNPDKHADRLFPKFVR